MIYNPEKRAVEIYKKLRARYRPMFTNEFDLAALMRAIAGVIEEETRAESVRKHGRYMKVKEDYE